jgi:single-stranded DNA-specific DHH superfamily exonuclease
MDFWSRDHYRWAYRTVIEDERKIDIVVTDHHWKVG